jgi:hypothetical protein
MQLGKVNGIGVEAPQVWDRRQSIFKPGTKLLGKDNSVWKLPHINTMRANFFVSGSLLFLMMKKNCKESELAGLLEVAQHVGPKDVTFEVSWNTLFGCTTYYHPGLIKTPTAGSNEVFLNDGPAAPRMSVLTTRVVRRYGYTDWYSQLICYTEKAQDRRIFPFLDCKAHPDLCR